MFKKVISLALSVVFSLQTCGFAQAGQLNLAGYLGQASAPALDRFRPAHLRYFSYEPASDNFQILLDKADEKDLSDVQVKDKADELMRYFRIGLSLPNDKFWVNLRPDAPEQIIDPALEQTDMGKIMLEADLQLKKDTSSLTSPQTKEGKEYWDKLYKKAGELFGTENITIPTITRPWIVPGEIIVRQSGSSAYIYKAALKVMLEEDYLNNQKTEKPKNQKTDYNFPDSRMKELNKYSTQLIRELIIPQLTKEVNRAKRYAGLRQVYYSLILARWFKQSYHNSGASEHQGIRDTVNENNTLVKLIDSGSLTNLTSQEPWSKDTYYQGYKKSFEQGEYNLSETVRTPTGQLIRRYVSGGISAGSALKVNDHFDVGKIIERMPLAGPHGVFFDGNSVEITVSSGIETKKPKGLTIKRFERVFNEISWPNIGTVYSYSLESDHKIGRRIIILRNNDGSSSKKADDKIVIRYGDRVSPSDIIGFIREKLSSYLNKDINRHLTLPQHKISEYHKSKFYKHISEPAKIIEAIKEAGIYASSALTPDEAIEIVKHKIDDAGFNFEYLNSSFPVKEERWEKAPDEKFLIYRLREKIEFGNVKYNLRLVTTKDEKNRRAWGIFLSEMSEDRMRLHYVIRKSFPGEVKFIKTNTEIAASRQSLENVLDAIITVLEDKENLEDRRNIVRTLLNDVLNYPFGLISINIETGAFKKGKTYQMRELDFAKIESLVDEKIKKGAQKYYDVSGDTSYYIDNVAVDNENEFFYEIRVVDRVFVDYLKSGERSLYRKIKLVPIGEDRESLEIRVYDNGEKKAIIPDAIADQSASRKLGSLKSRRKAEDFIVRLYMGLGSITASSAIVTKGAAPEDIGAVDFRAMDMLIHPAGSFKGLDFSPVALSSSALEAMDLDKDLEGIKQMTLGRRRPHPQRLKEYVSACIFKGKIDEKADDFIFSMLEVFQLQAEEGIESASQDREAVVLADTRRYVLPEKEMAMGSGYSLN